MAVHLCKVSPRVQIAQRQEVLRLATMDPFKEPARPMSHWDFVLKEMRWMAVDFTEVSTCSALGTSCCEAVRIANLWPELLKPSSPCQQVCSHRRYFMLHLGRFTLLVCATSQPIPATQQVHDMAHTVQLAICMLWV